MKNLPFLLLLSIPFFYSCSDNLKRNKSITATQEFAELINEDGFAEKHDEPNINDRNTLGETIKIAIMNEDSAESYQIKNEESNKYLFVIHEWWGLNNHIKVEADKWFKKLGNVNVIALDLYDGKVAISREKAMEYMQGANEDRIMNIIDAFIGKLPDDAEVGTIGWCFGGGWSLKTAIRARTKTKACVMFYGMPIKDVEKLTKINSSVMFIYGKQDKWINEEVAKEFEFNMGKANKALEVLAFDADHAFANPSSEHYLEKASQEANDSVYDYLSELLK